MANIEKLEAQVAELTKRVAATEDNPQLHNIAKVQLDQAQKFLSAALARVKPAKSEPAPPPAIAPSVATQPPPAPVSGVVEREDPIVERPVPEEVKEPASNEG